MQFTPTEIEIHPTHAIVANDAIGMKVGSWHGLSSGLSFGLSFGLTLPALGVAPVLDLK